MDEESATAVDDSAIRLGFRARRVFLVLGPAGERPGDVEVLLDGEPISAADAGADVERARVRVTEQRLYRLVELDEAGDHTMELRFAPGVSGYAFTFG